ncbi:MFS transporter [Actinoplanes sp. NPDC051851]|uniref:MFS transporter n=1 Tax=Actinoplanes sp. NPDC051851 TaxID=3154753 RepID=UPI003423BEA4
MDEPPPLRRNTAFQLLWIGSATSDFGTQLTRLAMPLLVLAVTGSPLWAGLIAGARSAATVLAQMPAGVWVDRWDRRRTLVGGQLVQAGVAALLAALVVAGQTLMWTFLVLAVVDGVCTAFIGPARSIAIRGVVPAEQLPTAFAQEEARTHAAWLAGPPTGGLLYGLGQAVPFVVDAVTLLVSAVCTTVARVPRRPGPVPPPAGEPAAGEPVPGDAMPGDAVPGDAVPGDAVPGTPSMGRELREAFRWFWRQPGLRDSSGTVMMLNLLGGATILPLIVLIGERGGDSVVTGAVLAASGIGGLAGALLSGRTGALLPPGKLLLAVVGIFGGAVVLETLPFGRWWPMLPFVCISLATPALNVVMNAVVTRLVPEEMLGRMEAVLTVVGRAMAPLGPILGGFLAATLGGAGALLCIGGALLLTAAGAATSRSLRTFTGERAEAVRPHQRF